MPVAGAVFVLLWCFGQGDGRSLLSYVSKAIVDFVEHFQVDQKCHETLYNLPILEQKRATLFSVFVQLCLLAREHVVGGVAGKNKRRSPKVAAFTSLVTGSGDRRGGGSNDGDDRYR